MTPTINVNLKPCDCGHRQWLAGDIGPTSCVCAQVAVPCPIPPNVAFTVRLGECQEQHEPACASHTVHVTCTIGGATWAGSDVVDVEPREAREAHGYALLNACRDLWALVKALMLASGDDQFYAAGYFQEQRDAVFASLARVARMERDIFDAQGEYASAMDEHHHPDWHRDPDSYKMPSQDMLALYVKRLIEEVGKLP